MGVLFDSQNNTIRNQFELSLLSHEIPFYLGGSRKMAEKHPDRVQVTDDTDWDYNVPCGAEVEDILRKLGDFTSNSFTNADYKDDQAVSYFCTPTRNVTVITRKDLEVYATAFEMVDVDLYLTKYWKSSPHLEKPFCKLETKLYFDGLFEKAKGVLDPNYNVPF